MKPLGFHSEAEEELEAAIAYYDSQRAGLGREFQTIIEEATQRIQENPQLYGVYEDTDFRVCVVKRFPYLLFYQELEDRIWIAAVAHQKRRPDYWIRRTPE